jgi:nucleotide-binding universal stress UspA family protein
MSTVVVGVDGSEGAVAALRFALDEARLRGCGVKVVSAWHIPTAAYESGWVPIPVEITDYEQRGTTALETTIERAGADTSGVEITRIVREGQPAEVLVAEATADDLLVVGSRGRGGFRGLLLGSTSQQCAHHAPCPVAIVPAPLPADIRSAHDQ